MNIKTEQAPNCQNENVEKFVETEPEWPKAQFRFELVGTLRKSDEAIGVRKFNGATQGKPRATTLDANESFQEMI